MAAIKSVKLVRLVAGTTHRILWIQQTPIRQINRRFLCQSSKDAVSSVTIELRNGLPAFSLPLPSTGEKCQFVIRPFGQTVENLCQQIKKEDKSITDVVLYTPDGVRLSSSVGLENVIRSNFNIRLNDSMYTVETPLLENKIVDNVDNLNEIRRLISSLHTVLNAEEEKLKAEQLIADKLVELKSQIEPLEKEKDRLHIQSDKSTNRMLWVCLGLMGVQAGFLGQLTWYEYSWDIMEPVTYFVTYSTVMAGFAYYCITRQQYEYHEVKNRLVLSKFHKFARKHKFDYTKYNELKSMFAETELQLKRMRDAAPIHKRLKIFQTASATGAAATDLAEKAVNAQQQQQQSSSISSDKDAK